MRVGPGAHGADEHYEGEQREQGEEIIRSAAPFQRAAAPGKASVNSRPPTAGPQMFAIWKMVAPQVTALTKCSLGTRLGSSALDAGPLNARPSPMSSSTA